MCSDADIPYADISDADTFAVSSCAPMRTSGFEARSINQRTALIVDPLACAMVVTMHKAEALVHFIQANPGVWTDEDLAFRFGASARQIRRRLRSLRITKRIQVQTHRVKLGPSTWYVRRHISIA